MNGLSVDLKTVSVFYVVQSDMDEAFEEAIVDEKRFTDYKEAMRVLESSEAPVKYLKFISGPDEYKLVPIEDSEEFTVLKKPIYN
jgi:hypothetical protein